MEKYNKIKELRLLEEERLAQEGDLMRSFKIQQFGVYNWDVWKDPERQILSAKFDFGDAMDATANNISVFLVTAQKRSVVRYYPNTYDKFSFDPKQYNELIAVLPGNKIAVFTAADFAKMDVAALAAAGSKAEYTFKMRIQDQAIQSMDDLQNAIAAR